VSGCRVPSVSMRVPFVVQCQQCNATMVYANRACFDKPLGHYHVYCDACDLTSCVFVRAWVTPYVSPLEREPDESTCTR